MTRTTATMLALLWSATAFAAAGVSARTDQPEMSLPPEVSLPIELVQRARSCRTVSSCREAVEMWCDGYERADADKDGIPCENVCPSKELVDRIREEIGC